MSPLAPLPRVLLLGRPNVGKSTLFNRLLERRVALTDAAPHTTRDLLAAPCEFRGARFELLDAAGFWATPEDSLQEGIKRGLDAAAAAADLIVVVFDAAAGLVPGDRELATFVRRLHKPFIAVVNKVDGSRGDDAAAEFWALKLENDPIPISAKGGYNCLELLEAITAALGTAARGPAAAEAEPLHIAVVGRPNVGKSSFLNRLAGGPRAVVHERPGTTRDAVDVTLTYRGRPYVFVDTAGIRRRTRAKEALEEWSLAKSLAAIRRADIVILILDGAEGPTSQDAKIAGYAHVHGRGLILFINKTDLLPGGEKAVAARINEARAALNFASYAPLAAGSAFKGFDAAGIYNLVAEVEENYGRRVGTGELNRFLATHLRGKRFTAAGKELKVRFAAQVSVAPPTFHLFVNTAREPAAEFARFVENRLREGFPYAGTPVRLVFRTRPAAART